MRNGYRCYTVEHEAIRAAQNPNIETADHFEQWLDSAIQAKKQSRIIGGVYQIPVIFHVINNGEAVGSGSNISQAALQSQIDVLNEDYRRKVGSNGYNTNPVGADCEIEFCLAQRKPDGSGFTAGQEGVERINRNTQGWSAPPYSTNYVDATIKPATSWDPSKYMNIWICSLGGGILGYAQFPTTSLGGLDCNSQATNTDGVVFTYNSIGKSSVTGFPAPYNEGRTATHEIGHWLGLRHIWGDGDCTVDDFCNDTPDAGAANYNCPTGTNSCTAAPDQGPDMIDNYMDYTDDLCMDIFTEDQKMRMRTVLESSPIRASLINSDACVPPDPSDVSVINITNPKGDNCSGSITPTVTIKNRGSNTLTSAKINYKVDNGSVVTYSYSGSLASGATANVNLSAFSTPLGIHTFTAYTTLPNGVTDPNPQLDTVQIQFSISNGINAPYSENFDETVFPPNIKWVVDNPDADCYQWQGASAVSITNQFDNKAAQFPAYGNSSGNTDNLVTPIFILPCNATAADLKFDVAYRRYTSGTDRLYIEISEDCGATWNSTPIYDKSGTTLDVITTTTSNYYQPTGTSDWRTETIDLTPFITSSSKNIKFRFRAKGNGNNIYVDNLRYDVTGPAEAEVTVASTDVLDEGYYDFGSVNIGGNQITTFSVHNYGTTTLTLTPPITVTGSAFSLNATFGTTSVAPGDSTTFKIKFTPPSGGAFTGNVSFGTNDCDENPYNFQLDGTGAVVMPVANFSGTPTTVCSGSTVAFTDLSSNATSWSWSFTGGTPSSSTAQNPVVTYNTPGTYSVTLTASNTNGSDPETKTNYITVLDGTGVALPISEGFVSGIPATWSIVNNNSSATWVQTTDAGNAPTAGNSIVFDNYAIDDRGDSDKVVMVAADLSGYVSAQLKFDVAYARYNASNSDGLKVLVQTGCQPTGSTSVYLKTGTTLATSPDNTSEFTPTTSQWRTETVDLTPYVGNSKVVVSFQNLADYGNRLFIDNVNLTGVAGTTPPVASFTPSSTSICAGGSVTFTNTSTNSPTSYSWTFTGGSPTSSTATSPTITYNTAGTYTVVLQATNSGGTDDTTMTSVITVKPIPTITSTTPASRCGTGSVTLSASASSGTISWFANASGGTALGTGTSYTTPSISSTTTYYVEVTNGGCTSSRTAVVATINTVPTISAGTVSNPSTCGGTNGSIQVTGSSGTGNLAWTGTASGSANGITLPHTISGLGAGSYSITFTNGSGCTSTVLNQSLSDPSAPATPTISANGPISFCAGGSVILTSSASTGNTWSTGATSQSITVTTSGSYSVTVGTTCTATSTATTVTVHPNPSAPTISTSGSTTFCAGDSVVLTSSSNVGNSWSTGETTKSITVTTSGTYTVTFTNTYGCFATSAGKTVTVNTPPSINGTVNGTRCNTGTVTLSASASSGTLSWYDAATGGTLLGTGTSFTTPSISSTTTYYVEATDNGCTSTRTPVTATVVSDFNSSDNATVCYGGSYTYHDGTVSNNITIGESHTSMYTSVGGCDSNIVTTVSIQAIDTSVTITGTTLVANQSGAQYQWISCKDGSLVTGETAQSFTPSNSGGYMVVVTVNGCSDTSSCRAIDHSGIQEYSNSGLELSLYPNPSNGKVSLHIIGGVDNIQVSILGVNGKLLLDKSYQNTAKIDFDLSDKAEGIYFFKVQVQETVKVIKYVKED